MKVLIRLSKLPFRVVLSMMVAARDGPATEARRAMSESAFLFMACPGDLQVVELEGNRLMFTTLPVA
jgi:hypothetical protein